jgi:hypothetical protein
VAEWHWELVTDDLLDGLPPAALTAVRQVAEQLTVRESIISSTGESSQESRRGCVPSSEAN